MTSFSGSLEVDGDDCPEGSISDVPTPWAAFRTRSSTFLHATSPYSGRSSVYGSISSSLNVPTPYAAYPTATTSPRSSRAHSGSLFPQISRTFSAQLWGAFPSGNTIATVLEDASAQSSATNSNPVSRHSDTPPSGEVSPSSSEDPLKCRAWSSASVPMASARPNLSFFNRRATLPNLPNISILPSGFSSRSTESKASPLQPPIDGQTTPSTSIHSTDLDALEEILGKGCPKSSNVPKIKFLSDQREMVRTMYLDNIQHATARLHKHHWVMGATNEHYKGLCGTDRLDLMHNDLSRYTQAIKDYEFWLTSSIQTRKLDLPPYFHEQGRSLAMFEFASHPLTQSLFTSDEKRLLAKMEQNFMVRNYSWSQANATTGIKSIKREMVEGRMAKMLCRFLVGSFGASAVIVLLLLVSLDPKIVVTFMATSVLILIAVSLVVAFLVDAVRKASLPQWICAPRLCSERGRGVKKQVA